MKSMNEKDLMETTTGTEPIFDGKIVKLRRDTVTLPNGNSAFREVIHHTGGVGIVPLCKDGKVIVVKQCRYPYSQILTEIPAGKLEAGEDPLECGIRELKEETGATAEQVISLGNLYPTPAYCDEIIYIYLAIGLTFGEQKLDKDEFIHTEAVPLETLVEQVMAGEISDAKTQIAILKVARMLQNGEISL